MLDKEEFLEKFARTQISTAKKEPHDKSKKAKDSTKQEEENAWNDHLWAEALDMNPETFHAS